MFSAFDKIGFGGEYGCAPFSWFEALIKGPSKKLKTSGAWTCRGFMSKAKSKAKYLSHLESC